ncbi:protein YgfX [Shewanella gelidii]|uniref:protein YgfX n=1 Tax=Shewanella gelidii TaxID=1642821 RepID=UPI0035709980
MDAQHLNIRVVASFQQRLAWLVLGAVCLTSMLAWPPVVNHFELAMFWLSCFFLCSFFGWQLWQLQFWQCQLMLNMDGQGKLRRHSDSEPLEFELASRRWVTPLACCFYIRFHHKSQRGGKQLIIIWQDMLPTKQYRHLSRILINSKPINI